MPARAVLTHRWNPALTLFLLLLGALWMAGGASHADVTGQVVTRGAAWSLLVLAILLGVRPVVAGARPVFWLLLATVLLVLLQLVPLPPNIWTALPGRDALLGASPDEAIWRPWAIVPSATANAASSLIVPVVTFMLMSALRDEEKPWLPTILLGVIFCAMLVGLLQFSSFGIDNPFINDSAGAVGGTFANRNHFAALLYSLLVPMAVWIADGVLKSSGRHRSRCLRSSGLGRAAAAGTRSARRHRPAAAIRSRATPAAVSRFRVAAISCARTSCA